MKKLVIAVVILVLLLGVAPWGIGRIAEGRLNKGLDKMVAQMPYVTVVERKWTGGWFRSEQEVTFELFGAWLKGFKDATQTSAANAPASDGVVAMKVADEAPQDPMPGATPQTEEGAAAPPVESEGESSDKPLFPASLRFTIKNEILHGPVLWTSGIGLAEVRSKIVLTEEIRKKLLEEIGTDDPVNVKTRVGFFGGGTTTFYGDGRTVKPKGGKETVSWEDFKLAVDYSGDVDNFGMKGKQPRIEITNAGDGTHVLIRDVALELESERIVGDLYDTDMQITVAEVSGNGADKKVFSMEGLHYLIDTDMKGEFIDIAAKLGTGEFKSADFDQIGLKLKEVHYDFSVHRLHAATLDKLSATLKQVYGNPLPVSSPTEVEAAILQPLKSDAISLFKHDPEIGIDRFGIVTAEGEGFIKGLIKFKGVNEADFANPMSILGKIDADFTVEVPQKMMEKFPNGATMAGAAVDSGYMKREGDKLICKLTYKAGALTVNGKPQALPFGPPPPGQGMSSEGAPEGTETMPPEEMPPPKE